MKNKEIIKKCEELMMDKSSKVYAPSPFTEPTPDQIEFMGYVAGITDVIKFLQSPIKEKRETPMIGEYEQIYKDWCNELPQFYADTPVTRVILECQMALRRVLQGTPIQEKNK